MTDSELKLLRVEVWEVKLRLKKAQEHLKFFAGVHFCRFIYDWAKRSLKKSLVSLHSRRYRLFNYSILLLSSTHLLTTLIKTHSIWMFVENYHLPTEFSGWILPQTDSIYICVWAASWIADFQNGTTLYHLCLYPNDVEQRLNFFFENN